MRSASLADATEPHIFRAPRSFNVLDNVLAFARAWDNPAPAARDVPFQRSAAGNINLTGDPSLPRSALATRHHPAFREVIEVRVRELVCALAYHHDLITYTSCEGHRAVGSDVHPCERHAGVLPRTRAEAEAITALFVQVAQRVNQSHDRRAVAVTVMTHAVTDGARRFPALDLYVGRAHANVAWDSYFDALEVPYRAVVEGLLSAAPLHSPASSAANAGR